VFALSSAPGKAGVAVIRLTGPRTHEVLGALCRGGGVPPHRMASVRKLHHPESGILLDEGLVIFFEGPRSFTGEDCGELHVHGGRAVVDACLQALTAASKALPSLGSRKDIRMAGPGEFSMRALLNGKMDLTSAEGVGDLINSDTEQQRAQALAQMSGRLERLYEGWRRELLRALAAVEACIDFGDDADLGDMEAQLQALGLRVEEVMGAMRTHLDDGRRGELLRDGVAVSIAGPPNAGKSSILNLLCDRQAAIVSELPGTTRDVVEVAMDVGGFAVRLADTAGIREAASDVVEEEGIRRAKERVQASQVRLSVVDVQALRQGCAATTAYLAELAAEGAPPPDVLLVNKVDLCDEAEAKEILGSLGGIPGGAAVVPMSARNGEGFSSLVDKLTDRLHAITKSGDEQEPVRLTRERHRQHVEESMDHLREYLACSTEVDIAAEELRQAAYALGKITGRVGVEDMLDILFKDFCIGK